MTMQIQQQQTNVGVIPEIQYKSKILSEDYKNSSHLGYETDIMTH